MKAGLEPYVYGDPPVTKLRKKYLSCGHRPNRAIISRELDTAWCWYCERTVRMVRVSRRWKILTRGDR